MNPDISSNSDPIDTPESIPSLEAILEETTTPTNKSEKANEDIWTVGLDAQVSDASLSEDSSKLDVKSELDMELQDEISQQTEEIIELDIETHSEPESKPAEKPELFVDQWLDESLGTASEPAQNPVSSSSDTSEVESLVRQKVQLQQEIEELVHHKKQLIAEQSQDIQLSLSKMIEEGTKELQDRKTALRIEIEQLERRLERINQEMRSNFAGSSKELAIRVQGFKEYLVGSLQDLVTAAEKLELTRSETPPSRTRERVRGREGREDFSRGSRTERGGRGERGERPRRRRDERGRNGYESSKNSAQFGESTFAEQGRKIRQLLDQYCNKPDYYGSPWQLRRTFEKQQAQKVQEWFFGQGGRGTIETTGSRLQNILVASAAISILHNIYTDSSRVLVLTDSPENLGEWRRGLQDCLGISRSNFGTNRGVTLFDSPDALVQRAERLITDKLLPIIIIDETEELLNLSVLKFPLWLAFASNKRTSSSNYLY